MTRSRCCSVHSGKLAARFATTTWRRYGITFQDNQARKLAKGYQTARGTRENTRIQTEFLGEFSITVWKVVPSV